MDMYQKREMRQEKKIMTIKKVFQKFPFRACPVFMATIT